MSIIVFVGPTLPRAAAAAELDATFLPPAGQGDVYLAARERPDAIALIDGYFKHTPAVWHKEVLWALSQGVHVFGAASMGALRACELAPFGMIGVGEVYERFAAGELEDDDEVTIVHGDASTQFQPLSDAMVNIRATLERAQLDAVLSADECRALIAAAKAWHYSERTFARLLADAPADVAERLSPWLEEHSYDVKQADALALLCRIRCMAERGELDSPHEPNFRFAHTDAWEQVRREIRLKALKDAHVTRRASGDAVLNELRVAGADFQDRCNQALVHALSQELADGLGEEIDHSLLAESVNAFRVHHDLTEPNTVQPWLARQGLDVVAFTRLLKEALITRRYRALYDGDIERTLIELLRMSGDYARLHTRAEHKQEVLSAQGQTNPSLEHAPVSEEELWSWFAAEQRRDLAQFQPRDVARELGYRDAAELRREVLREWLYRQYLVSE